MVRAMNAQLVHAMILKWKVWFAHHHGPPNDRVWPRQWQVLVLNVNFSNSIEIGSHVTQISNMPVRNSIKIRLVIEVDISIIKNSISPKLCSSDVMRYYVV